MQELLNQAFIFNGLKIDENYKNKSVFSYIVIYIILIQKSYLNSLMLLKMENLH